PRIISYNPPPK
ncbi:Cytoplasmic protein, partial [Monkeypox virus]